MHTPAHFAELVADAVAGRVRPAGRGVHELAAIHTAQDEFSRCAYVGKIVVRP